MVSELSDQRSHQQSSPTCRFPAKGNHVIPLPPPANHFQHHVHDGCSLFEEVQALSDTTLTGLPPQRMTSLVTVTLPQLARVIHDLSMEFSASNITSNISLLFSACRRHQNCTFILNHGEHDCAQKSCAVFDLFDVCVARPLCDSTLSAWSIILLTSCPRPLLSRS